MKNLLLFLAGLAVSNKGSSSRWIAAIIMGKLRIVSMVLVFSILCLTFISSAIDMILLDLQKTTESQHQLAMTSVSAIGLGIVILSLTAICLFFRKSIWGLTPAQDSKNNERIPRENSPIIQALTSLVADFVDDRRIRRRARNYKANEEVHNRNV